MASSAFKEMREQSEDQIMHTREKLFNIADLIHMRCMQFIKNLCSYKSCLSF